MNLWRAERVWMLGGFTIGSLQEFLDHTRLGEQSGDVPHLLHLLADHGAAIRFLGEKAGSGGLYGGTSG